uniref:Uncharacterized protein n=1 Tax=Arundo donax TaxID=35708 RepID=A0A0A9CSY1_ARUDO
MHTQMHNDSCTPSASAGKDVDTLSAPPRAALLAGASSNTRAHTPNPLHRVEHWNLQLSQLLSRITGRRGLLNRHQMTGGLLASPMPCTAGMSAPSQTC